MIYVNLPRITNVIDLQAHHTTPTNTLPHAKKESSNGFDGNATN